MWLELTNEVWINSEFFVKAEFAISNGQEAVTLTSIKPGGSDRSIYYDEDARKIKEMLRAFVSDSRIVYGIDIPETVKSSVKKSVKNTKVKSK